MGLIKSIYILPDKYFYNYYNDYITKKNNSESDYFILNLLKCKGKLITPTFITKNDLYKYNHNKILNKLNNLIISREYYENFKLKVINNHHICNICYDNVTDNYIITQCLHTYCLKCANTLYFNNKKQSIEQIDNNTSLIFKKRNNSIIKREFKCSICSHQQNREQLFFLSNKILNDISLVSDFYFNHSYAVIPKDKDLVLTTTIHEVEFASIINFENIYGMQFHPEKSSEAGKKLLRNFLSI